MDQRQLCRYPVLTRLGVFGVDRESLHGGREFLDYARGLLEGRQRALWITAVLYVGLWILAIVGYVQWRRSLVASA